MTAPAKPLTDADRLNIIRTEIATMVAKDPNHSLVERLTSIVEREIRHTHAMHGAYADFLTDRYHAALSGSSAPLPPNGMGGIFSG